MPIEELALLIKHFEKAPKQSFIPDKFLNQLCKRKMTYLAFVSRIIIFDYTHRQKLSNSKLVLNIKKMFRTKILEIQVLLSSFDFIRIEYQCN